MVAEALIFMGDQKIPNFPISKRMNEYSNAMFLRTRPIIMLE